MVSVMSTEWLETELCSLAARVAALTCEFLLAVGEYDRRRGWEAWECRDMATWLSWKCGMSPVTAREHVRVARALGEYALVRERFREGRLTYSQVRAVARAVTPGTEAALVELASVSTAAQLEQITRAFRRTRQAATDTAAARHAARYLRYSWDDDGNLVGSFSFPAEDGAALVQALEAHTPRERVAEAASDGARDEYGAARADTLVELVAAGAQRDPGESSGDDHLVTVVVDAATLRDGTGGERGEVGECRLEDGPGLAAETARRLACDAAMVTLVEGPDGQILDLGRKTRVPNAALRRAMRRRDGHCRFPGCRSRRVQAHHMQYWTADGPTSLGNLVSLCRFHHRRVHEGGYRVLLDAAGGFHFRSPAGFELEDVMPIGPAEPGRPAAPVEPYASGWDGSRLDLGLTLDCLLQHTDSAESPVLAASGSAG